MRVNDLPENHPQPAEAKPGAHHRAWEARNILASTPKLGLPQPDCRWDLGTLRPLSYRDPFFVDRVRRGML